MSQHLRHKILNSFKSLHRTRQIVFDGDAVALEKGRNRINDEYRSKQHVTDPSAIAEMLELAKAVEIELRTTVCQAEEVLPGKYALKINKDTVKLDNIPYKECNSS